MRYVLTFAELYLFFHTFILLCAVILQHYVVGSCPFDLGENICMYVCMYVSDSLTFFVLLFSITGPNFMFLALFYQELNRKMCFWDIAILVKIRDFPWFWPNFGHKTRDKTPTRHFCGHFSLFSGVTHRITWENTYKPVRMTKMWQEFTF